MIPHQGGSQPFGLPYLRQPVLLQRSHLRSQDFVREFPSGRDAVPIPRTTAGNQRATITLLSFPWRRHCGPEKIMYGAWEALRYQPEWDNTRGH